MKSIALICLCILLLFAAIGCDTQPSGIGITAVPTDQALTPEVALIDPDLEKYPGTGYYDYATAAIVKIGGIGIQEPMQVSSGKVTALPKESRVLLLKLDNDAVIEVMPKSEFPYAKSLTLKFDPQSPASLAFALKEGMRISYPTLFIYAGYEEDRTKWKRIPTLNPNKIGQIPAEAIEIAR